MYSTNEIGCIQNACHTQSDDKFFLFFFLFIHLSVKNAANSINNRNEMNGKEIEFEPFRIYGV